MSRRPGLTLTEVLVTLAILAFGILAILTLFPLAASQMAIAVREDRSAQAANAADGYLRAVWKSEVVDNLAASATVPEAFYHALRNPNQGYWTAPTPPQPQPIPGGQQRATPGFADAPPGVKSYPVIIDPMGYVARSTGTPCWAGDPGPQQANVARRTLNLVSGNQQYSQRLCSLMDGLGYDDNGHPFPSATADRELRYNWMWVVQRDASDSDRTALKFTVVVFDNRPHLYAPTGSETVRTATPVTPKTTQVTLAGIVDIKPGGWIMDATVTDSSVGTPIRNAEFYRVVSVDVSSGNTALELETPLAPDMAAPYNGTFVVFRGISGVYKRLPLLGN